MEHPGIKIRNIRLSRGISQEDLALKSGVNVRTIQRIEAGQNMPHGKTLQLICETLGLLPEDILKYKL